MEEIVVLNLFSERRIPIKVCNVRGILFEKEPTMSGVASLILGYVLVGEELDVDVFISIGVFNPIPLIFCIAVPMSESGNVSG